MATTVRFFQRCLIISLLAAASWSAARAEAAALPVTVYLFTAQGCLHCRQEKDFLDRLEQTCPGVKVVVLELTESQENQALFARVAKKLQAKMAVVPFTVIGEQFLVGWQDSETTGKTIEELILKAQSQNWPDVVAALRDAAAAHPPPEAAVLTERLTLPLVGAIELRHLSIVVLTVIIAALDGFNPCAMWVLVFLIGLLLGMGDRRKMWVLGSVFIAASGLVYLLFMTAWLNLFLFLGLIFWVRLGIGGLALAAGGYNLREYWINRGGVCKVTRPQQRQKIMQRLRELIYTGRFFLALAGMVALAFFVNLIELLCSTGFPVIYTQILSLTPMPVWHYYLYLGLYILIFILDDLLVFGAAMLSLKLVDTGTAYKRWSSLVGGVLMVILGLLLILRPQWLSFG